jgi:hypothetical protein
MRHMIRHERVDDTPWSRVNVYMRTDIYGVVSHLARQGGGRWHETVRCSIMGF